MKKTELTRKGLKTIDEQITALNKMRNQLQLELVKAIQEEREEEKTKTNDAENIK